MTEKVRRIDMWPEEFLAGIAGELSPAELGVYWMVCLLCYTHGGSIHDDLDLLRVKFSATGANRVIAGALSSLVKRGKIRRADGELSVSRVRAEVEHALSRVRASAERRLRGGRASAEPLLSPDGQSGEINGVEPLARITHNTQHTTHNTQDAREPRRSLKADFADWWAAYPHKVGKGAAERAFGVACKSVTLPELLDGVRRYIVTKPPDRPWCNPSTWLNQRRWEDEPDRDTGDLLNGAVPEFWNGISEPSLVHREPEWAARLRGWAERPNGFWLGALWGPGPGEPGCQAPPPLLAWAVDHRKEGSAA